MRNTILNGLGFAGFGLRLFCAIGDIVIVSRRAEFYDEDAPAGKSFAEIGARYRVVDLVERGDLVHESGSGPFQIRVLNSSMPSLMTLER